MSGRIRQRLFVRVALVAFICLPAAQASSWQDSPSSSSSGGARPDPPAYRGEPRRDEDGLYRANVYDQGQDQDRRPPDSSSSYTPIHYQFKASDAASGRDLPTDVPLTELDRQTLSSATRDDDDGEYASARTDVVTKFISNKKGRVLLTLSSGAVGAAFGTFLGKVQ